jgi:DNA-binding NtrC family response regulator
MEQQLTKILVIEDEDDLRFSLEQGLAMGGYEVAGAGGLGKARRLLQGSEFDLVLTDLNLTGESALTLVNELREGGYEGGIVMITAFGTIETAVEAMKRGADDFLQKPVSLDQLTVIVERTLGDRRRQRRLRAFEQLEARREREERLVGKSEAWQECVALAERLATLPLGPSAQPEDADGSELPTVLLLGETGVGKGLLARHIHATANRIRTEADPDAGHAPFVHVNCAALPESLAESELFGHDKGAFTDAREARTGLFEAAEGGTIFLDEIGDMPVELQTKLLHVLERGVFRRVGSSRDRSVRTRVVAATNQDLHRLVEEGRFRRDLLYRLSAFTLRIPPLRERDGDTALIADAMLERYAAQYGRRGLRFSKGARAALSTHSWPGNVRELVNAVQRAAMLCEQSAIEPRHLAIEQPTAHSGGSGGGSGGVGEAAGSPGELRFDFSDGPIEVSEVERTLIVQALEHTKGNISQAAKLVGMNRTSFRYRVERAGLEDFLKEVSKR